VVGGDKATAVIVPVSAAEQVVGTHRLRHDRAASWGIPAHVTVLYPFLPPPQVDQAVIARLERVFSQFVPFDCVFSKCGWFGEDVLWLAPDPSEELLALTAAVCEEFPQCEPYEGEFDEVVPHLTIAVGQMTPADEMREIERQVSALLPVTTLVDSAVLMAGADRQDSWHALADLPLGPRFGRRDQ
jgi:2'-5' RNA ligase